MINYDNWSEEELRKLKHNDHRSAFMSYVNNSEFVQYKHKFLYDWIHPNKNDYILECGSSSGKTCVDFSKRSNCRILGVDFDSEAIEISTELQQKYFPELTKKCKFKQDDLSSMSFDKDITKVLMPDFTEHIPNKVFSNILANIKNQLPDTKLYIYTPDGNHIFEKLKKYNFILKNCEGHINVKTANELKYFLNSNGWEILNYQWRPSHIKYFCFIEKLLSRIPLLGNFFRRRIVLIATPRK
jgi:ribosomal protein L11 methylase PrmA